MARRLSILSVMIALLAGQAFAFQTFHIDFDTIKDPADGGSYEMFLYSAKPVPGPTTIALVGLGGVVLLRRR